VTTTVSVEMQELKDQLEPKGQLEQLVPLDFLELWATRASQANRATPGLPVTEDRQVSRVHRDSPELTDTLDRPDHPGRKELLD
jgi:hypothetical protein